MGNKNKEENKIVKNESSNQYLGFGN